MRPTFLLLILLLTGCGSAPAADQSATPEAQTPVAHDLTISADTIDAAEATLRAEPQVADVLFQRGEVYDWTVAVKDDGTRRDGYADYLCMVLRDGDALEPGSQVRIVDMARMSDEVGFRDIELGTADCGS